MTEILNIVKMIAGSNGGAAVITAAFLLFVFWVYGKFVRMSTRHDAFDKSCTSLNDRVSAVEKSVNELRGDMQYVKSTLNTLVNMIQSSPQAVMQAHSPLALTPFGEQLAEGFNADDIVTRNFSTIRAKIDADVVAKTPYDVQTYCLEKIPVFPESYLTAEDLATVKSFAFNNGRTLFECLKIIGLKARDAYFKATGLS